MSTSRGILVILEFVLHRLGMVDLNPRLFYGHHVQMRSSHYTEAMIDRVTDGKDIYTNKVW